MVIESGIPCKSSGGHYYGPEPRYYNFDSPNPREIPPPDKDSHTMTCVYCGNQRTITRDHVEIR